jgi:hypothetical protein
MYHEMPRCTAFSAKGEYVHIKREETERFEICVRSGMFAQAGGGSTTSIVENDDAEIV